MGHVEAQPGEETMKNISMRQLLEAGVHFGHQARFWNPKMGPYIFGLHQKIHIINLEETLPRFRDAVRYIGQIAANRGKVMFVGTKFAARDIVREEATRCGMPYVNHRWLGGMLTNYKTIRQSIKRLKELEAMLESEDALIGKTKKELLTLTREKDKLSACLEGIKNMGGLPDALFVIDVKNEKIAIQEANRLGIPVIGIVDTNSDPDNIDFMIPGNDDALRSIRFYCNMIAETVIEERGVVEVEAPKKAKTAEAPKVPVKKKVVKKQAAGEAVTETGENVDEVAVAPAKKKASAKEKAPAKKKPAVKKVAAKKKPAAKKKVAAKAEGVEAKASNIDIAAGAEKTVEE